MAIDTLIPQLVINKMTQSQYDEALENGAIVGTEIYFIPSDGSDVGGGGAVASVNGQIGEVNLTAEDVGAIPVITGTQGQVVGFDANGNAVAQDAPDSGVGKNVENTVYTITDAEGNEIEVIAGVGAEVFNDYENNKASGQYAHAEGFGTTASSSKQHVQGISNIEDIENKYAHIVGNGEAAFDIYGDFTVTSRSNAHTLDWDGNAWFAGDVYVGSTSGVNKDEGSVKLAKEITMTGATSSAAGTSGLVPTPAAGDEDKFLKGDGTWAESGKVTSVNGSTGDVVIDASSIGAATTDHTQAASTITAGTFAGQVVANSSSQAPGTSLLRNSKIVSSDTNPSNNGEINWTYG